jgi:glycogen operon protein
VPGVQAGQIYGFRFYGPSEPDRGLRFDPSKLLLDPYGRAIVVPKNYCREAARLEGDNTAKAIKNVVTDSQAYDWTGDMPLRLPWSRTIIYEMHVRGFTAYPSSAVAESKGGRSRTAHCHVCRHVGAVNSILLTSCHARTEVGRGSK